MVSVKGGSKGCNRCRERKVKCDQTRPSCLRCQKMKTECPGYVRPIQFVRHILVKGNNESNQDTLSGSGSSTPSDSLSPSSPDVKDRKTPQSMGRTVVFDRIPASVHVPGIDICIHALWNRCVLSPSKTGEQLQYEILRKYFTSLNLQYNRSTSQTTVSEIALSCSAVTSFGKATANMKLQTEGVKMYNVLLRKLRAGLVDERGSWRTSEFFHSCVMATVYEILVSKDPHTWMRHAAGLSKLIEARGANSFSTESEKALFVSIRFSIAMYSLNAPTPCVLAKEAWQNIPWIEDSRFNTLLDKVVILPGLLCAGKHVNIDPNLNIIDSTIEKAISLIHDLLAWRTQWNMEHPLGADTISEVSPTTFHIDHHHDESGPLFESFLSYQSVGVARPVLLYDVAMLRLIHLVEMLLSFGASLTLTHAWKQLSSKMQKRIFTDEICRTIPFLIQPMISRPGGTVTLLLILLLAGRTTYVMLDGQASREGRFLERVVQFVTSTTGSTICVPVVDRNLSSF